MKKDKRIIYIQNKINKNAFYSRNRGVLFAKGEYILIIDPDDLLLNNILIKCYEMSKYFNLDILQYFSIRGSYEKNMIWFWNKYKSGILYSEKVKNVFFYSISRTLWDKLIKREVFIKGINFMKKEFQKETYFVHSDDTIFWGIINSAKSYGFLEQIGYFYNNDNPVSIIHHYYDPAFINIIFHSLFATLKNHKLYISIIKVFINIISFLNIFIK
jgi:glycosyltransferase involved in cell wall biosynthesis